MRLRHGIYAKPDYDPLELANKIYTPSYISLETVLAQSGVIFQYYDTMFLMSYLSRDIEAGGHTFSYRRLPDAVLLNKQGIEQTERYAMATKERAFLDAVYVYKTYHFDNLGGLNWELVLQMTGIYQSSAHAARVQKYYQLYREEYADTRAS